MQEGLKREGYYDHGLKGLGILKMLNEELLQEDPTSCRNYLRLSNEQFEYVLQLVQESVEKQSSIMQETISARSSIVLLGMSDTDLYTVMWDAMEELVMVVYLDRVN
ncbi:hypothetical protein ILUMI_00382 [Ignelater luminosus]|uniref:Uncharacterized protein n=1 Tax=Ignelater luminosus TaxID=2038154 RepID=A0A8K0GLA2_IGNLU|nr:hypothetical protein ILUMI_00382 [Ignelater luminosus]